MAAHALRCAPEENPTGIMYVFTGANSGQPPVQSLSGSASRSGLFTWRCAQSTCSVSCYNPVSDQLVVPSAVCAGLELLEVSVVVFLLQGYLVTGQEVPAFFLLRRPLQCLQFTYLTQTMRLKMLLQPGYVTWTPTNM